ncbi:MAG TPA: glycosyltransferase family 4 protein [Candidatus Paceibacterota bacterium]
MKKILYIANIRFPTERAHGIQIAKMCEAFARSGTDVTLVVPWRFNHVKTSPFEYYDIESNFTIKKLPALDLVFLGRIGFWIETVSFMVASVVYSLCANFDIVYSREEAIAWSHKVLDKKVIWEAHMGHTGFMVRSIIKSGMRLVVISEGLKKLYQTMGSHENRILVAPDAVDVKKFSVNMSKSECRKKLGLPIGKKIVMYTGHLYEWKGVNVLAEASQKLPADMIVVFVGGTSSDVERFSNTYGHLDNLLILGQRNHDDIPYYLKSADMLVLPNSGKSEISRLYTSPMKLFEYMASGVPIVASDLPSVREVVDDGMVFFTAPDNPANMSEAIISAMASEEGDRKAIRAKKHAVTYYDWMVRARVIIKYMS